MGHSWMSKRGGAEGSGASAGGPLGGRHEAGHLTEAGWVGLALAWPQQCSGRQAWLKHFSRAAGRGARVLQAAVRDGARLQRQREGGVGQRAGQRAHQRQRAGKGRGEGPPSAERGPRPLCTGACACVCVRRMAGLQPLRLPGGGPPPACPQGMEGPPLPSYPPLLSARSRPPTWTSLRCSWCGSRRCTPPPAACGWAGRPRRRRPRWLRRHCWSRRTRVS
jgi:hypothetical protein